MYLLSYTTTDGLSDGAGEVEKFIFLITVFLVSALDYEMWKVRHRKIRKDDGWSIAA